jgi:hypothetical protein
MPPELNRKGGLSVLPKIDEILTGERRTKESEVRAGRRLERLKSFDEFLARRSPESRRKAYYFMSIYEHSRICRRKRRRI